MDVPINLTAPDALLDRLAADAKLTVTRHGGRKIAWRQWGQGPALVLLHGASGSWRHWVRNIDAFSDDHTVIAPDLPGFGDSDEPDYPAHIEVMGQALANGLDQFVPRGEQYNLVAFSYGGSMASQLLTLHRGRQSTFVICAAAGLAETRVPPMVSVRGKTGADLLEAHRANLLGVMIGSGDNIDPLALRIQHENTLHARLRVRELKRGPGLSETLDGFNGRVGAIWGLKDTFLYEGALEIRIRTLLKLQPRAEIKLLPEAGHWLAYEASEEFNAFLRRILS